MIDNGIEHQAESPVEGCDIRPVSQVWIDQAVSRGGEAWREAVEQQLRDPDSLMWS